MDLRLVAFNLLFGNVALRPLLVNYADRLDCGSYREGMATGTCFIALQWSVDDSMPVPIGSELLTAEAHMPRDSRSDDGYLSVVLQRLRAALTDDAADGLITIRCLQTSPKAMESGVGTIFRTSTFEIAPASPQRRGAILGTLVPWTGWAELGAAASIAARVRARSMN